jgi:flagellar biosynthesis/type III secretory pathway protein FliH
MSEPVVAPFRPAPVGGVLGGGSRAALQGEQARAAGWSAGWAAGTRAAAQAAQEQRESLHAQHVAAEAARDAQVAAALTVLRRAAEAAAARAVPVLEEAADTLDEGAVVLAQAVLGAELSDDDARARAALARALRLPLDAGTPTVRLHPADLAVLTAAGVPLPTGVQLQADGSLRPGDAVSELPDGFLDARISTAVERALHALAGVADGGLPAAGDLA